MNSLPEMGQHGEQAMRAERLRQVSVVRRQRDRIGPAVGSEIAIGGASASPTIFTIGHSTRTIAEFVALLRQADIDLVVDVRSIPRSRTTPQFNGNTLPETLAAEGIGYRHLPSLGGRRHHRKDEPPSANTLWRVVAFRDYADYAETESFRAGLDELLAFARDHRCVIMCAEAVWWRCHRRIVADYLLARGVPVEHILGAGRVTLAALTPGAQVTADGTLRYPRPNGGRPRMVG